MKKKHLDILKNILKTYRYTFYIFGSRCTGRANTFSDVDLFYKGGIPKNILSRLEEALEESDLPYKVDLVSYDTCDAEFKRILDRDHILIEPDNVL